MPGIFGGVGCGAQIPLLLRSQFERVWGSCEFVNGAWGGIGAHCFSAKALGRSGQVVVALDGESSVYAHGASRSPSFPTESALRSLRGNAAVLDTLRLSLVLSAEDSGSFPLYYASTSSGAGLVFCSNLEALASVVEKELDPIGIVEYLRNGYTLMGRTYYSSVRRLQPGQVLRFSGKTGRSARVTEESRVWTAARYPEGGRATSDTTKLWNVLTTELEVGLTRLNAPAIMLSAGWDSRTLLAAALSGTRANKILAYTHGDAQSRELRLAKKLAAISGVAFVERNIDDRTYDLDCLGTAFRRVGSVQFPHWYSAGKYLARNGRDAVLAGVYGEVLGGHYGTAMASSGSSRAARVLVQILGMESSRRVESGTVISSASELLHRPPKGRPWYCAADFWHSLDDPTAAIKADLDSGLTRLHSRGIDSLGSLVEAFITEHRGTQLINMQLLSCRAHLDVAMPFASPTLLSEAAKLDQSVRIHNKLNLRLLKEHAPQLLRPPCAATLVPASWPILLQELSRGVRRVWEDTSWRLHFRTRGLVGEPRLGWLNLQFLRDSHALTVIAEDLHEPIWDHGAVQQKVAAFRTGEWQRSAHLLVDQLMKIYTVELSLRGSRIRSKLPQ